MPRLFILGNGFDRAHDLKTSYSHFKKWLLTKGRLDVIAELQSIFPAQEYGEFLLWSQFEKALTQYDKNAVEGWALDSLFVSIEESVEEKSSRQEMFWTRQSLILSTMLFLRG